MRPVPGTSATVDPSGTPDAVRCGGAPGDARPDGDPDTDREPGAGTAEPDAATVARLMAEIAAGRRSAIWELHRAAGLPVRARVRGELRRLGVRYDADDLDALVIDAVLAIADVAGAWRPGGAPPWSWAHHRVVGVVHRWVGTFADSLEALGDGDTDGALGWCDRGRVTRSDGIGDGPAAADPADTVTDTRAVLRRLATNTPLAAELDAALSALVSPLAAAVWLAVLDETEAGNRHPAVTIGARFGMHPDAVRKTVQRVRQRLAGAAGDERFAALASLPTVAGRPLAA
ncbi:MAG TPA: hypothetical protein VFZ79_02560 [Acidimicrobiales bacterium]